MYKVITESTIEKLEIKVNKLLKENWNLAGGMTVAIIDNDIGCYSSGELYKIQPENKFCQSMIKEDKNEF